MRWEVEVTDEFRGWYDTLSDTEVEAVNAAVDALGHHGPAMKRPVVGAIEGSGRRNLKELRVGTLRIIFAFDPRRVAILLLGGDKHGQWSAWYGRAVARAEALYDEHLKELGEQGLIPDDPARDD